MWTYRQSTGEMIDNVGEVIGVGYSGHGEGKNNSALEKTRGEGPIPDGLWHIGGASLHTILGPVVMSLTPDETTETYGRSGFYIHGDSSAHPGQASHGCIVLGHDIRVAISLSEDKLLNVIGQ